MQTPKFGAGQRVSIISAGGFSAPSGMYRVISALPLERGSQRYRVKNDNEVYDRVLEEARLQAAEPV